jgi:molybdopterin synthase sulfur carrier subunit
MTINILAFGIAKEILGAASRQIVLGSEIDVTSLKSVLQKQYPRLSGLTSFAIAVNGEYAREDKLIRPGDEIAIIPPVSGG